jgi:hypothetical protein
MAGRGVRARRFAAPTAVLAACLLLAACSQHSDTIEHTGATTSPASRASGASTPAVPAVSPSAGASASDDPSAYAVPDPGHLTASTLTADVLVTSSRTIPDAVRARVAGVKGVAASLPLSIGSLSANGRTLTIASGDLGQLRRFTPVQSGRDDAVWKRVAGGEVAVDPTLPKGLQDPHGFLRLGTSDDAPDVHIGAYAPLIRQIPVIVNTKRAEQLGMPHDNGMLISTGELTPSKLMPQLKKALGPGLTVQTLALEFDLGAVQTAVLTAGSVTDKVGTFTYTPHADGSITPDQHWVSTYIRTERMPIIGDVTCNKGMLPQLRGALTELVRLHLADRIHPQEYGGCFVPRYIGHNPAEGLSLHSWGIAVDLNVPENARGTAGHMDPAVVQVFKRWGFAWGGDWHYTDPMHFEMNRVVAIR